VWSGVSSAVLEWLTGGSALAALVKVLFAVGAFAFGLTYRRYLGILGADRRKPVERQAYDALRESLAKGNVAARLYAERLTQFLDWVDSFFGDAGMADRTLLPHAFGLKTPVPLWTVPAFDRCLLLGSVYPLATILLTWAVSGHVGPVEVALRLRPDLPGWQRGLAVIGFGLSLTLLPRLRTNARFQPLVATAAATGLFLGGFLTSFVAFAVITVVMFAIRGAPSIAGFIAFAGLLGSTGFVQTPSNTIAAVFLVVGIWTATVAAGLAAALLTRIALKHRWQGVFLTLLLPVLILGNIGAAGFLSTWKNWEVFGPVLLFLGLVTLLAAPFNWASVGLARALLRRGLELGGWWPYLLTLVGESLFVPITAGFALVMVIALQAFNGLALNTGGAQVVALYPILSSITTYPTAPEYAWIYGLLFSVAIPSLVSLIGGFSLMRGVPGVRFLLLRFMPERSPVPKFDRAWIATVLTAEVAAGAALGIAAQAFLVVVIIGYVMPFFGLELLDVAREVADFDLPARVGQLLRGML
jgi:hypothetical protein